MPERFLNSLSLRFARMRSVKVKFFAAIAAVAVVFILVITSLNLFFYESYYMAQRQNSLTEIYEEVRTSYQAGDSEAFLDVLFRIENSDSVRLSIIDGTGQMIYDSDTAQESQNIFGHNVFANWRMEQLV